MKKLVFSILSVMALFSLQSCSSNKESVYEVIQDDNTILKININNITDELTLNLSEIAGSVEFIPLETNDSSIVSIPSSGIPNRLDMLVGENSIIILNFGRGMFQFSSDGRFIRKLMEAGRGPCEFIYPVYAIDEAGTGMLYVADHGRLSSITMVDLNTGECLGQFPRALQGVYENILPFGDSLLLCAPAITADGPNHLIIEQNLTGDITKAIRADKSMIGGSNVEDILYRVGDSIYLRPVRNDTIFQYVDDRLIPKIVFHTGNSDRESLTVMKTGDIEISLGADTRGYTLFSARKIKSVSVNQAGEREISLEGIGSFLLDKQKKRAYSVVLFFNDYLPAGVTESGQILHYPITPALLSKTTSASLAYPIPAPAVKAAAYALRNHPDITIDNKVRERILEIDQTLKKDDNPVIMIIHPRSYENRGN